MDIPQGPVVGGDAEWTDREQQENQHIRESARAILKNLQTIQRLFDQLVGDTCKALSYLLDDED